MTPPPRPPAPSLAEVTRTFARIGCLSFGGPAAQIALMHRIILDEKRWVAEADYLRALSFCMLLPGPEAMQLATWIGWRLQGVRGGLIAGGLFVLPGALVVLGLSLVYAAFGQVPVVAALFVGVQAAVIAIVIEALLRVSKRALKSREAHVIAAAAFAGLFLLDLPFPLIILAAAIWGFLRARPRRRKRCRFRPGRRGSPCARLSFGGRPGWCRWACWSRPRRRGLPRSRSSSASWRC